MTHIRILFRNPNGSVSDGGVEFGRDQFAGELPAIGDTIVYPGVAQGRDRTLPQDRQVWSVVGRVFNPRDREDAVALIVETRDGPLRDEAFL